MNSFSLNLTLLALTSIDWVLIAVYAVSTIALGWWFGRKQKSTEEYFVGSGAMNPILIGVSLFATLLSTISYLSMPGEVLGKGPAHMAAMAMYPVVFMIVAFCLLPIYMRQRVTSAYALLEERLGLSVRLLGALMFIGLRLVWMSLLIYLSAKAVLVMMDIHPANANYNAWMRGVVIVTGTVAVIYTSLGGLRAVVITDLLQTILLFGGALLVIAIVTVKMGGFSWFPTSWQSNWDTQPLFDWDPSTRVTVLGAMLSMSVWFVCTLGGDQTTVQRFMATKDAAAARRALAMQLFCAAMVQVVLALVGFALLAYYAQQHGELPASLSLKANADEIFPHFIAHYLPPGVSGLVVAAMFAAAMSSLDSGVNSITAVVMSDFCDRLGFRFETERSHVIFAKLMAVGIGLVVVFGSAYMDKVPGNITSVTQKTSNLLTTPIFALFFFALFVPFSNAPGVFIGAICGTTTAVVTAFSGPIFGQTAEGLDPISFQWIGPASLLVNLATGTIACLVFHKLQRRGET